MDMVLNAWIRGYAVKKGIYSRFVLVVWKEIGLLIEHMPESMTVVVQWIDHRKGGSIP